MQSHLKRPKEHLPNKANAKDNLNISTYWSSRGGEVASSTLLTMTFCIILA